MSNSNLSFFNRSGNSPTLQPRPNKIAPPSAERGKEYRKKRGAEAREQDRVRKQVARADAKTPEGMRILEAIVGNESVDENTRNAAAKKILATPKLSTTRGSRFNNAPSGCGKLVYTGHANLFGNRYSPEEQQIMGSEPSEELVDTTADDGEDDKEPEIEIVEEVLEAGGDGDDDGEDEEVVVEDVDEAGDASYLYFNFNERGRRVTANGATGSDSSKDGNWVSFHDKEQWRHSERQKEHQDERIVADLVTQQFNTTAIDGKEHYECDLCKELIFWPRERRGHILEVHGSRNSPSHDRHFGNIIAQYKKQLKTGREAARTQAKADRSRCSFRTRDNERLAAPKASELLTLLKITSR
jgi:hypothetical protein